MTVVGHVASLCVIVERLTDERLAQEKKPSIFNGNSSMTPIQQARENVQAPTLEEIERALLNFDKAVDAEDVLAGTVHAAVCTAMLQRVANALRSGSALLSREDRDWQPIETAPKGQLVIVYFREGGTTTRRLCATSWDNHVCWRDVLGNPGSTPTHWMPLPAPPKGTP
jgi:hypothetical protein